MLADIGHEHSAKLADLVPSIRSSIVPELNTALDIIKHEGLRNVDAAVRRGGVHSLSDQTTVFTPPLGTRTSPTRHRSQ